MTAEILSDWVTERAAVHRALGDENRLRLVESLILSDRTPGELATQTGLASNLLAFHLRILEEVGIVDRRQSEGDSRRRYVHLRTDKLDMGSSPQTVGRPERILFVCTHNSARSQFAEAVWRRENGCEAWSAGTTPAKRVHPRAVDAARAHGIDLSPMRPKGYDAVPGSVDLVISVCDRAFESEIAVAGARMHWSVPDPIHGGPQAFESAFDEIADRVGRLRGQVR
ncbi:MAG: helix-turn-helix domain-containing protein [Acidimicrobiia bacterium]